MSLPCLRQTEGGVELSLLIQPRSSRNQVVGVLGEELKVKLTAAPVNGAANIACCAYLAKLCKLPKSRVTLISGSTSKHKRVLLHDIKLFAVNALLVDLLGVDNSSPTD